MKLREEYKIVINVDTRWSAHPQGICQGIMDEIKRHVDGAEDIDYEVQESCPHCYTPWEECCDEDGDIVCCLRLQEDHRKEQKEKKRKQLESATIERGRVQIGGNDG